MIKNTNIGSSANWSSSFSVISGNGASVYCGGFFIDEADIIHLVINCTDTYGSTNRSGYMYYLYSPPTVYGSTTESGRHWYAANGSPVAWATEDLYSGGTNQPMRHMGGTANAAIIDISPAKMRDVQISANFLAVPCPQQPIIFKHSCCVGNLVPPPTVPTIRFGRETDMYKSPFFVTSTRVIPTEASDTQATSCPHAIKIAVKPFA